MPPGLEEIGRADWEDAVTRATKFAQGLRVALPRHLSVEDLVHTAVEQVLDGTRSFDPTVHSLAGVLCNTVRSIVSPKGLAEYSRRMPLASEQEQVFAPARSEEEDCLFSPTDRDVIFGRMTELAKGNQLLVDYIEAFRANLSREETAEFLEVSVEKTYELQRELKALTVQVVGKLKPVDKPY